MEKNDWIYDMEIYPNLVLLGAKIPGTNIRKRFQLSPLGDDRQELAVWLLEEVNTMIGYNNIFYDSPMLHYFIHKCMNLRGSEAVRKMFNYSVKLIKALYPPKIHPIKPQIDLFKINHFDNKARMTSLKLLEFNLRAKNLQSLPYPFDTELTKEEIWEVIDYNDNDLDATELVYNETKPEIVLREKMSPMFNIDFTNFNSTKMGEHILISKIIEELGEEVMYNQVPQSNGSVKKVVRNTKRDTIDFSNVVFDYVEFKTEPFQKLLQWFKSQVITETKGVFSKISVDNLEVLEGHYATKELKWHPKKEEFVLKNTINTKNELKTLNVVYKDFRYDFGVGGIHGCIESGIYDADENHDIIDIDVASFYPNIGIKNKIYPEHIGPAFCPIYFSIYIERQKYPKKTHKAENSALKLALNGSYGKSNSKYSPLCDPKYTMLTTVNGQLLLCMLAENLMERVPDCLMLQINTDGLTIKVKKSYVGLVNLICEEWENLTELELESVNYSRMIMRDVNNYVGIFTDGSIKRKGAAFIYKQQSGELELHKNFSQLVVPKALEAYFKDGTEPLDFFKNHNDVYDFFKRTKIPKTSKLMICDYDKNAEIEKEEKGQNISRYLVTGKFRKNVDTKLYYKEGQGNTLIKIMPPLKDKTENREFNVEESWLCTTVNTLPDNLEELKNIIDYDYYVEQAYKVIDVIKTEV